MLIRKNSNYRFQKEGAEALRQDIVDDLIEITKNEILENKWKKVRKRLKIPAAPPPLGGISAKTKADKSAMLQQACRESPKCKEVCFLL